MAAAVLTLIGPAAHGDTPSPDPSASPTATDSPSPAPDASPSARPSPTPSAASLAAPRTSDAAAPETKRHPTAPQPASRATTRAETAHVTAHAAPAAAAQGLAASAAALDSDLAFAGVDPTDSAALLFTGTSAAFTTLDWSSTCSRDTGTGQVRFVTHSAVATFSGSSSGVELDVLSITLTYDTTPGDDSTATTVTYDKDHLPADAATLPAHATAVSFDAVLLSATRLAGDLSTVASFC